MNIWRFNLLPSLTVNKFNSLTTSVGFWGIRNILNRNVLARFARNRIYRFTRLTRFWVITWNIWDLTRSSFTRVIRIGWELWLWSIRNWLTIWAYWNDMTIWSVGNSNCGVRVVLRYCCSTGSGFSSSVALNNRSIDLAKCVVAS